MVQLWKSHGQSVLFIIRTICFAILRTLNYHSRSTVQTIRVSLLWIWGRWVISSLEWLVTTDKYADLLVIIQLLDYKLGKHHNQETCSHNPKHGIYWINSKELRVRSSRISTFSGRESHLHHATTKTTAWTHLDFLTGAIETITKIESTAEWYLSFELSILPLCLRSLLLPGNVKLGGYLQRNGPLKCYWRFTTTGTLKQEWCMIECP